MCRESWENKKKSAFFQIKEQVSHKELKREGKKIKEHVSQLKDHNFQVLDNRTYQNI